MRRVVSVMALPARALYEVAADVGRYPSFVPWCRAARSLGFAADGAERIRMEIAFGPLTEAFVSKVRRDEAALEVEARLDDADCALARLTSLWRFTELGANRARAALTLDWRFKNRVADLAARAATGRVAASAQAAFERQARAVHAAK